jgi:SnoaL-like domain
MLMEESEELAGLVRRLYEMMRAADADAIGELIADHDGVLVVGTDEEWWQGAETARRAIRAQHDEMGAFDITAGDVHGYSSGDVAWFQDQPTLRLPDGAVLSLRLTGVAERGATGWALVQLHVSIPAVVNEALTR